MRRTLTISFMFLLLFVTGCAPIITMGQSTQLTGSGKLASQDFSFDKADRLLVASNFKVTLTTGDSVSVTAQADDNVMEHLYVHVSNGELRLEMKPGRSYSMTNVTMKAEVTMPVPSSVTLEDNATLDLSGIQAAGMTVRLKGNAILTGAQVSVPRLSLTSEGNGMARLSGAVAELTVDGSGNTKFAAPDVQVHTAKVHLRDNGTAALHVTDNLDYDVSGNAGIIYTGTPKLGEQKRSGNGYATQK